MYEVISLFATPVSRIILQFCMIAAKSGLEDLILETSEFFIKLFLPGQIILFYSFLDICLTTFAGAKIVQIQCSDAMVHSCNLIIGDLIIRIIVSSVEFYTMGNLVNGSLVHSLDFYSDDGVAQNKGA